MDRAVELAQPRELARQPLQARKKQAHLPFDVGGRGGLVQHHVAEGLAEAQVDQLPCGRRRRQAVLDGLAGLGAKGLRDVALGDAFDRGVHVDGFREDLRYVADDLHGRPGLRDDHRDGCRGRGQVVELGLHRLQAMDVHGKRLREGVQAHRECCGDDRQHRLAVRLVEGGMPAVEQAIEGVGAVVDEGFDRRLDPRRGALQSDGAVAELVLKLAALVVDAVVLDDGRDQAEPCVRRVDAHDVDAVEEKLQRLAERARLVVRGFHELADVFPLGFGLRVALGRLDAQDDCHDGGDEGLEAVPAVEARLGLLLDEVQIHGLTDAPRLAAACELVDAVADLAEDAQHAHEAGFQEPKVVGQAVPERLMEALADSAEDGVLRGAAAFVVELEGRVHKQLVRQMLVAQPSRERPVCCARG